MKKTSLFALTLLSLALCSCGTAPASSSEASSLTSSSPSSSSSSSPSSLPSSASSSTHDEEVNMLKELLSKQDLSPVTAKVFTSTFAQDYEMYTSNNGNEDETESQFYSYHGAGLFGCLYEVSEEAYEETQALENPDFFDYLARGKGSYAMLQRGSLVSYNYEIDEEEVTESLQSLDFVQNFDARFTDENVQVVNSLVTKATIGNGAFSGDAIQRFNGLIDKETLFDTITVRAFSDIFARTNLFDGQRSSEAIDRIYFDTLKSLNGKSDAELSAFIEHNAISFEEDEENILVHFTVGDEELRASLDEHEIFPGSFAGTLTYEKQTGAFSAYEYQIIHAVRELDEESGYLSSVSMEFKASGYSRNERYDGGLYIDPDATVYEDAEQFLQDIVDEVIPPLF